MTLLCGILIGAGSIVLLDVVLFGCVLAWMIRPYEEYPTKPKKDWAEK